MSTNYVGKVLPIDIPCSLSTGSKVDFDLLWTYDNNGITSAYGWQYQTARNMAYCSYNQSSGDGNNCWLFSPALNIASAGTYQIVLNAGTTMTSEQSLKVAIGQAATSEGMTQTVSESIVLTMNNSWVGTDTEPVTFTVTEPGTYYIGIMTQTTSTMGFNYFVKRLDITTQAAAPAFSPEAGAVEAETEVTITSATEKAKIYYTTDGTEPTAESTEYTKPIAITADVTIKAIAIAEGYLDSDIENAEYTVILHTAAPTFNPEAGEVEMDTEIEIACETEGATIHYTTDGTEPTAESTEYTKPIAITADVTIKAIAIAEGHVASEIATATYTVKEFTVPEHLYIFGNIDGNGFIPEEAIEMDKAENVFTHTGSIDDINDGDGYFAFTEVQSSDWTEVNAARWSGSKGADQPVVLDSEIELVYGVDASLKLAAGYYEFKVVFSDFVVNLTVTEKEKPGDGVSDIMPDAASQAEYFNLQGIRVVNPAAGNIYIVRRGNTATKVYVK